MIQATTKAEDLTAEQRAEIKKRWRELYPNFEPNRTDTQYVLSCSYGKDSLACIGACMLLGWRIDRIVHAEVWATNTIPAELPPMWNFKEKADKIIKDMIGIEVERYCATTYEEYFYKKIKTSRGKTNKVNSIYGFPYTKGAWCNDRLKVDALEAAKKMTYEKMFYTERKSGKRKGQIYGFPFPQAPTCNSLKTGALRTIDRQTDSITDWNCNGRTGKASKARRDN